VETTRYALNCLHVGPDYVEATDGCILGRLTVPGAELVPGLFQVPDIPSKQLAVTSNRRSLRLRTKEGMVSEGPVCDKGFPPADTALVKPDGPPTVTYDAKVLRRALDVVIAATPKGAAKVHFRIPGNDVATYLEADTPDGQFSAVVMPWEP